MDRIPLSFLRNSQRGPRLLYRIGLGPVIGGLILLLTTTGRKSGLPRVTPLQYETLGDEFLVGSFRGPQADWFRNLEAHPQASVQAGRRQVKVTARLTCDRAEIVDYLKLKLKNRPRMTAAILRMDGIDPRDEQSLGDYASHLALAVLTPVQNDE